VGRAVSQHLGPQHEPGETIMRFQSTPQRAEAKPVDIHAREGELVAVTGLVGAGVSRILRTVGGVDAVGRQDSLWFDGSEVSFSGPRQAQEAGIGFVSQDRKGESVIPLRSAAENIALPALGTFGRLGVTLRRKMAAAADECQKVFSIKWTSAQQPISSLSGGNQQKAVLSRWIVKGSRFLVIQEPSQGVDIGARQQIHDHLVSFAEKGGTVLFSSSDLDEVRDIAHRIYVMHAGEVVAEFENDRTRQVSREELTQAMANLLGGSQVKGQTDD
jgi:ABC-type sugar transport system ATPase subunit